jgi:uncharacterized membrane protein
MNDLIPDKRAYQINKRRMAWASIGLMAVVTVATIVDPGRMSEADSILMAQYISLSGLVGAYFGFSARSQTTMKTEAKS